MSNTANELNALRAFARPLKHEIKLPAGRVWDAIKKYTAQGYLIADAEDGSLRAERPGREIKIVRKNEEAAQGQ